MESGTTMTPSSSSRIPLEPATVWHHVNDVLKEINPSLTEKLGMYLRPITDWEDAFKGSKNSSPVDAPLYFGLQIVNTGDDADKTPLSDLSFISFFVGYSTWEGLCIFVDQLGQTGDPAKEHLFLQILAKIAVRHGSKRLTWKVSPPHSEWYQSNPIGPPDVLQDLHIFRMDRTAMEALVDDDSPKEQTAPAMSLDRPSVEARIQAILESPSCTKNRNDKFAIRLVRSNHAEDADAMERLVKGLAVYTKEPLEDIHCDAKDYLVDGRGNYPIYYCFLIEPFSETPNGSTVNAKKSGEDARNSAVGIAVVYFGHSHESGRFLYLEDLYVEEAYRHQGAGSMVLKMLTALGLATGCNSFQWLALEWNKPALDFYQNKMGAKIQEGKKATRYTDKKLRDFAESYSSTLEGI